MRIISGKYRGKILKEFNLDSTKPTTDMVKESIFNLIQFEVADAVVLDLFSGTGALGIEAISRGAKKTYLNDFNKEAIKIIKENLKTIEGNYIVSNKDYIDYLSNCNEKFDIIFLDPPYKSQYGKLAIEKIIQRDLLNEGGIIIFETDNKSLELNYPGFDVKIKRYGNIFVYKLVKVQ